MESSLRLEFLLTDTLVSPHLTHLRLLLSMVVAIPVVQRLRLTMTLRLSDLEHPSPPSQPSKCRRRPKNTPVKPRPCFGAKTTAWDPGTAVKPRKSLVPDHLHQDGAPALRLRL